MRVEPGSRPRGHAQSQRPRRRGTASVLDPHRRVGATQSEEEGPNAMRALLEAELTPAEESEEEEQPEEASPTTQRRRAPYNFKQLTPPPKTEQPPPPSAEPSPPATPAPATPKETTPDPTPPPSPPRCPPLPRCLSQFRGDNWFDHHYPRARPESFHHIRPPPGEDGQLRQIELQAVVDMLCSK